MISDIPEIETAIAEGVGAAYRLGYREGLEAAAKVADDIACADPRCCDCEDYRKVAAAIRAHSKDNERGTTT